MTRAPEPLRAMLVGDLESELSGWGDPVAFGAGWDGAFYAAARRSSEELTLAVRWLEGKSQTVICRGESLVASFIQPFPGGVLLVGARCHWHPEGPERNAVALDWNGRELGRFTLGDGIQDVRVARDGTIWVSYFDEGVFGNCGWSHPGPPPIGAAGLVAFSPTGERRFAYDAAAARTDSICDAYAVNVANDGDVWVYFYSEFPIVRIHEGTYQRWALGVGGARALAIRGDRALLFGDHERPGLGRVTQLRTDGRAAVVAETTLTGPSGEPLDSARATGIGERLIFIKDRQVLAVANW